MNPETSKTTPSRTIRLRVRMTPTPRESFVGRKNDALVTYPYFAVVNRPTHHGARRAIVKAHERARQGVVVREVISRVVDDLLIRFERQFDRFAEFRDRRHYSKGRAEQGLAAVVVVGALAALGALTAVALTTEDSGGVSYLPPSNASSVSFADAGKPKVVTVHVDGRPSGKRVVVRTVSRRVAPAKGVLRLPAQTVRDVLTLTTERTATVTDVQPVTVTAPPVTVTAPAVTVTVVETVKCNKKKC